MLDGRAATALLFGLARTLGWYPLLLGIFLQFLAWQAVARDPVERPILGDYSVVLWPAVALICPAFVPHAFSFLRRVDTHLHWTRVRPVVVTQWTVLNLALASAALGQPEPFRYLRNALLCMGLAALLVSLFAPVVAAMIPVVIGMFVWLFGSSVSDPPFWNLLSHPSSSFSANIVALIVFGSGSVLLCSRPGRRPTV